MVYSLTFHVMVDDGLIYLCASESSDGKRQPYAFLNEVLLFLINCSWGINVVIIWSQFCLSVCSQLLQLLPAQVDLCASRCCIIIVAEFCLLQNQFRVSDVLPDTTVVICSRLSLMVPQTKQWEKKSVSNRTMSEINDSLLHSITSKQYYHSATACEKWQHNHNFDSSNRSHSKCLRKSPRKKKHQCIWWSTYFIVQWSRCNNQRLQFNQCKANTISVCCTDQVPFVSGSLFVV